MDGAEGKVQGTFLKAYNYFPTNPKYIHDKQFYLPQDYEYRMPGGGTAAEGEGIDGWMTHGELDWLYRTAKKVGSILELGSWKGRSTHALLSGCPGTVTCVDTWKGSLDPRDMTNAQAKAEDILATFQKNVGHFTNLEICQMESAEAAAKFIAEGRKFDMVFIDAGHTYEEVKRDIELWRPLAKVILSGHDYLPETWMGVCQAVDECCGRTYKAESIWYTPAEPFPDIKGIYPRSIAELQENLELGIPFVFMKYNDGEQQCMESVDGQTIDGQPYSFELNAALRHSYSTLQKWPYVFITHWRDWFDNGQDGRMLLHREKTDLKPLHDFYRAVKESASTKVFVGQEKLGQQVGSLLDCGIFIAVPEKDAFAKCEEVWDKLKGSLPDYGIVMFSCGLLSKVLIARAFKHTKGMVTLLDTGSSFDPIFLGQTRTLQAPQAEPARPLRRHAGGREDAAAASHRTAAPDQHPQGHLHRLAVGGWMRTQGPHGQVHREPENSRLYPQDSAQCRLPHGRPLPQRRPECEEVGQGGGLHAHLVAAQAWRHLLRCGCRDSSRKEL